jgi:hypothetical protein
MNSIKKKSIKKKSNNKKSNKKKSNKKKSNKKKHTLKKQYGGFVSPFNTGNNQVAGYIYTREKNTGIFYFGFVRKLYKGGRIRLHSNLNTGAAGTKDKYMGKWTSIGGSRDQNITHLKAIINELNDETYSNFNSKDVDASSIKSTYKSPINPSLILHSITEDVNGTIIFVFEMPSSTKFFNIFPKSGNTFPELLSASHGEIDAIQSYSMSDIMSLQLNNNQNYFIYYCINNFNKYIKTFISSYSKSFYLKWYNKEIPSFDDQKPRYPFELKHNPYREISSNVYV